MVEVSAGYQDILCPERIYEYGERYEDILKGRARTYCKLKREYIHTIDFNRGTVRVIDEPLTVLIEGEIVVNPSNVDKAVREIQNIKTRHRIVYEVIEETPCTTISTYDMEYDGRKLIHLRFICRSIGEGYKYENIERMLKEIRRIADKYGARVKEPLTVLPW